MHTDLKDILFLDIETVGCADDYTKLSERLKTQWARKAGYFKRETGQTMSRCVGSAVIGADRSFPQISSKQ